MNFTSALATVKFYKSFHDQAWEEFNSRKICKVAYARVQVTLSSPIVFLITLVCMSEFFVVVVVVVVMFSYMIMFSG